MFSIDCFTGGHRPGRGGGLSLLHLAHHHHPQDRQGQPLLQYERQEHNPIIDCLQDIARGNPTTPIDNY